MIGTTRYLEHKGLKVADNESGVNFLFLSFTNKRDRGTL